MNNNKISLNKDYIQQTDFSKASTKEAIKKLLALTNRPTAIVAFNDYVALDAIKCTRAEGLQVNKDIFFVSYANLPITSYLDHPPIASVEQFPYQQAEKAMSILLQLINSKGEDLVINKRFVLESKVIIHPGD